VLASCCSNVSGLQRTATSHLQQQQQQRQQIKFLGFVQLNSRDRTAASSSSPDGAAPMACSSSRPRQATCPCAAQLLQQRIGTATHSNQPPAATAAAARRAQSATSLLLQQAVGAAAHSNQPPATSHLLQQRQLSSVIQQSHKFGQGRHVINMSQPNMFIGCRPHLCMKASQAAARPA
jgi:hypothetical protein